MRLLIVLAALASLALASESKSDDANAPVIQARTPGCYMDCTFVINRSTTNRVVVTLEATPDLPLPMFDRGGNTVMFSQTTVPILLQAGETRLLSDLILIEAKTPPNPVSRSVTIKYRISGYYVPKPDLRELPPGVPEDFARFYVQWQHYLDGTPACGKSFGSAAPGRYGFPFAAHSLMTGNAFANASSERWSAADCFALASAAMAEEIVGYWARDETAETSASSKMRNLIFIYSIHSGQSVHIAGGLAPVNFRRRVKASEVFVHDRVAVALQIFLRERSVAGIEAKLFLP